MTTLTITPNLSKKTARFVGAVAAGEHVEVTLKFGALITNTSSLRMRVVGPCGTLAIFPQPESEDAWEVSGEDLKCVLNLNTIQMLKALAPAIEAELLVVLDDAENHVLYFKDTCAFKHWPMRRGDETPYDLDEFPGLIEEWREEIDNIAASVEKDGNVATISITDKDGTTTTAEVRDGEDGQDGRDGTDGVGIPAGGTPGQILVKASAEDYDAEWRTAGGGGGEQVNWNETDPSSPAYIKNKPTSFAPSAHASTHAANGSDPITPADIGALAENGTANEARKLATLQGSVTLEYNSTTGRFRQDGMGGVQIGDLANMSDIPALAAPSASATNAQAAQAKAFYEFVNSSINNMAAFYLTADAAGNAFATKAALTSATVFYNGGVARTPTKNDYLIVLADESKTTALGVNPTTRYVYDGSAWAFQYVVNNNSLTQAQVNAINSNITAALVAWLSAFKGTDTATTLASLVSQIGGKLDATNPVLWGPLNFETAVSLLYNATSGNLATHDGGEDDPRDLAHTDELEYNAANDDTRPEGLARPRSVSTYKVVTGTPLTITLPTVSASDKVVSNLDLFIDAIGVTTLPAITIQPATGGKVYAVKGTMPEIKADCITMIDATSIPGMNAWTIIGASELKEVANA